jgi:hypothetical protein
MGHTRLSLPADALALETRTYQTEEENEEEEISH